MRTNSFTIIMSKNSDHALETILKEKKDYTDEAIQAVIWELENRNLIDKTSVLYQEILEGINATAVAISEDILKNNESSMEELVLPDLYSKKTIRGFTIFFATIFGVILLMQNLKEMNKPKARIQVLVFGMLFTIFSIILFNYLPKNLLITLLFNLIGSAILIEFFWNKNLGKDLKYKRKEIRKPLIHSILILLLFIFLQLYYLKF